MPYKDMSSTMININNQAQDSAMNNLGAFLTGSILGGGRSRSAGPSQEARVLDQMKASQVQQEIGQVAAEDARMGRIDRLMTGQGMQNQPLEAMRRAQGLALGLDEKRRDSLGKQLAGMTALQGVTPAGQPAVPGQMSQEIADAYQVSQGIQNYGNTMTGTFNAPIKVNGGQNVAIAPAQQRATGMAPVLYGRNKPETASGIATFYSPSTDQQFSSRDGLQDIRGAAMPADVIKRPVSAQKVENIDSSDIMHQEFPGSKELYAQLYAQRDVQEQGIDLLQQLEANDNISGLVGSMKMAGEGISSQFKALTGQTEYDPAADFDIDRFIKTFDGAPEAAVFHSTLTQFAYNIAKSNSPSGRVSNQDFDVAKGMVGGNALSSVSQIRALVHKKIGEAKTGMGNTYTALDRKRPADIAMPPHLAQGYADADFSTFSDEQLGALWASGNRSQKLRQAIHTSQQKARAAAGAVQ